MDPSIYFTAENNGGHEITYFHGQLFDKTQWYRKLRNPLERDRGEHPIEWQKPLLMSIIAGLATGLGGLLTAFVNTSASSSHISFCLGLSAGVMLCISIVDLLLPPLVHVVLRAIYVNIYSGIFYWIIWFGLGILAEVILSKLLPDEAELGSSLLPFTNVTKFKTKTEPNTITKTNTKSNTRTNNMDLSKDRRSIRQRRFRLGILLAVTLALHNFPEGLAVAASNLQDEHLGFVMTIAIALHNIPEGLCVAVPIYAATGSLYEATKLATLSGLTEPLGAIVALFLFSEIHKDWHNALLQYSLIFVGGVMVSVSVRELIPEAIKTGHTTAMRQGLVLGAIFIYATMHFV